MKIFHFQSKAYKVDEYGFLIDPKEWDEDFAIGMSRELLISELTDEHWEIIRYIRERYLKMNSCPVVYNACRHNDMTLDKLRSLFPTGYQRGACKIAGVTYKDGFLSYHYIDKIMPNNKPYDPDKTYLIDSHGFLVDPSEWDESFAVNKADELKMPNLLTEKHWEIIYYLRDRFEKTNEIPTIYQLCNDNNLDISDIEALFPDGYHRGAVKLAGLKVRK